MRKAPSRIVSRVNFSAGARIFGEGDESTVAYVVQKGAVLLSVKAAEGVIPHMTVRERQVFGEMALLEEAKRTMTATAIVDTTCIVIREEEFRRKLQATDPLVRGMLRVLARSLSEAEFETSWDAFRKREGIEDWIEALAEE